MRLRIAAFLLLGLLAACGEGDAPPPVEPSPGAPAAGTVEDPGMPEDFDLRVRGHAWPGLGNYKILSVCLLVLMAALYVAFS